MDQMAAAVEAIMDGMWSEEQIGLLLSALRAKGETVAEVAGAARAMRRHMTPIRTERTGLIDTCGTGGSGSGTFNISTTSALVTAAAGVPVAKHGNRRITSKTGSADVLAELGVNIEASISTVEACLDRLGICFCFAPLMHQSMHHVAAVRKKLGVPTIFNILGPLTNPAGATFKLLGVGRPELRNLLAEALVLLGVGRALVVRGEDGQDEVSLAGTTLVTEATAQGTRQFTWTPEDFGISAAGTEDMLVNDPAGSAAVIRQVLRGKPGPPREMVVLNAAAALWTAGKSDDPRQCALFAAEAIDSGAAAERLTQLVELSNRS